MMFFGPDIFVFPMAVALAASPAGTSLACKVPKSPYVAVKVMTDDIEYDFSRSARDLTGVKSDSISPYAAGADTVSGGLREDHPSIKTQIEWQVEIDQVRNVACMWYDKITIHITLDPKIFVAREFNVDGCREAVLQHERKHVDVDHIVINKFATDIGQAVQKAVDIAGVMGPFSYSHIDSIRRTSTEHIESTVNSRKLLMEKDMRAMQSQVDSIEEYQRVSAHCKGVNLQRSR
jgi:hypothetical protein